MIRLPEKRICSKCGVVRPTEIERRSECGLKRSRKLKPRIMSFWKLPEADRREVAHGMYEAITRRHSGDEAAVALFIERELPLFKEYERYFRLFRWSFITDGVDKLDLNWYRQKPDRRVNPFTGLLWPPRDL